MTRRSSTPTPKRGHAGAVGTKTPTGTHPSLTVPTAPTTCYQLLLERNPNPSFPLRRACQLMDETIAQAQAELTPDEYQSWVEKLREELRG